MIQNCLKILRGSTLFLSVAVLIAGCGESGTNSLNPSASEPANIIYVPRDYPSLIEALAHVGGPTTIRLAPGTYAPSTTGETFPIVVPNDVTIEGTGNSDNVIIDAELTGGVFSLENVTGVTIQKLTITGGEADQGGGVLIRNASVILKNNIITANHARMQGNALFLEGTGNILIENNLISRNTTSESTPEADPHTIRLSGSNPNLINNTIVHGDGNGILITGPSPALVMNNIIAFNGKAEPSPRGRGICQFSSEPITVAYNLFFGNVVAAILTSAGDMPAADANNVDPNDGIFENLDGDPIFIDPIAFTLDITSPALNAGDPEDTYDNKNGSRNTIGYTGGPNAL